MFGRGILGRGIRGDIGGILCHVLVGTYRKSAARQSVLDFPADSDPGSGDTSRDAAGFHRCFGDTTVPVPSMVMREGAAGHYEQKKDTPPRA